MNYNNIYDYAAIPQETSQDGTGELLLVRKRPIE
jgi:hypothetical protein